VHGFGKVVECFGDLQIGAYFANWHPLRKSIVLCGELTPQRLIRWLCREFWSGCDVIHRERDALLLQPFSIS